eukprot:TRINITY_DN4531_c1_g1_i1.p1 TRINITY_DN4531_c1_g1~~TRINITY_DN4531_c1_g1_i1.p1  ORF type:complete len:219 (+),score=40.50 TRINITY_DN4531_c1_g1_i1:52-708(+)
MSRINTNTMENALSSVLSDAQLSKRQHAESVELHVNLKNYDVSKDKRFAGRIVLPNITKPRMSICIIADAVHYEMVTKSGLEVGLANIEDLKKLNKNKKLVKKFFASADVFLASSTLIKTIPRCIGPHLGRIGKFPSSVSHDENLSDRIAAAKSTVKFQLKKVLCLGVVVGHTDMDPASLKSNTVRAINFLVSLLKKRWLNIKSLHVKSTFGKPIRLM